jgi:hypothetical protein
MFGYAALITVVFSARKFYIYRTVDGDLVGSDGYQDSIFVICLQR